MFEPHLFPIPYAPRATAAGGMTADRCTTWIISKVNDNFYIFALMFSIFNGSLVTRHAATVKLKCRMGNVPYASLLIDEAWQSRLVHVSADRAAPKTRLQRKLRQQ